MKKYITKQGDTWDLIAFNQYGSCDYMNQLVEANPDKSDVAIFSSDVLINIPDINIQNKTLVPKWRT